MAPAPSQPIPHDPRRIILLNPTKYLGNLLLAGGLIQDFAAQCRAHGCEFLVVLDASFEELCSGALTGTRTLWYPRQAIRRAGAFRKLALFGGFLSELRSFRADLAFNLEEDSLTSRLTQLSGARFRLGCSLQRHRFGYEHVLRLSYGTGHRWYDYEKVFKAVGLRAGLAPSYMNLHINQATTAVMEKMAQLRTQMVTPLVAVHPSATKEYKKWPESAFIDLCNILINNGFTPALLGAGNDENQRCQRIADAVLGHGRGNVLNLCNRLSLAELAGFFRLCKGMAGNDSGPSHLASAQQLPGVVVFGPSDPSIWGPLGSRTQVLRKADRCDPRCSRKTCFAGHRCLQEISPQEVFDALITRMGTGGQA